MPDCQCGHPFALHVDSQGEPGLCEPCFGDNPEGTNWCECKDYKATAVADAR
jgi:hypothetical protein